MALLNYEKDRFVFSEYLISSLEQSELFFYGNYVMYCIYRCSVVSCIQQFGHKY